MNKTLIARKSNLTNADKPRNNPYNIGESFKKYSANKTKSIAKGIVLPLKTSSI